MTTPSPLSPISLFSPGPSSKITGIALIILGVLAIAVPLFAASIVTALLGVMLLLAGVAQLVYAWSARGAGSHLLMGLVGVVYLLVGVYLVLHPARALVTLTLLLAMYFLVEGVVELVVYFRTRAGHHAGWILWNGIITLILGAVILAQWPFSSVWVLGTLVGISLLMSGIARLSFRARPPLAPTGTGFGPAL